MSEGLGAQQMRHFVHLLFAVGNRAFVYLTRYDLALYHRRPAGNYAGFGKYSVYNAVI